MSKKVQDLVTSIEKPTSSTRRSAHYTFAGFRRADEEEKILAREEKQQIELEKIAREATALRVIEDEEKRITEEQNRIKRNSFVTDKISNAFGTKKTVVIEQEEINNTLNKAFIPTKNFPEPFEEEPALNRELAEFKKKIHEHIAQLGLAHSSGGGAGYMIDLDDVQSTTAKVDGKVLKYSSSDGKWVGASVLTGAITGLDIDGATDIGAAIVDADLFIIDDGAGGTNRKTAASRLKTYIGAGAADDLSAGDAAVTLTTTSGNITIDAAANNTDIIFKGTDATADITMLTLDGSAAGAATFNDKIVATELDISGDVDVDGTMEADAYTVDGTTLAEYIADTAGAMVSSNTETGITVTYQDSDNTIDFVIGTLNQNTTGTAATVTTAAQPNITSLGTLTTLTVDDMTLNGSTISDSGDFTIDCGADIILDADGGNIKVKDGGTTFFDIQKSSNDAQIFSRISDGDLVFRGNDGGSTITALTLDMSEGGVATFADDIVMDSDSAVLKFGDDQEIKLTHVHNQGLSMTSTHDAPLVRRGEDVFIVLNGTNSASANAGDNIVQDTSANDGDDIIGEDEVFVHTGMQRDVINIIGSDGKVKKSIAGFSAGVI